MSGAPRPPVVSTSQRVRELCDEIRDAQPIVERCLFCDWTWIGLAGEGRQAALEHRKAKHPEAAVRKARVRVHRISKKALRSAGEEAQITLDAAEANRRRAEREEADRLAKVLRAQAREAA